MSDNAMAEILLSVRGLRTSFFTSRGVVKAVDGLSFDLCRGECLCIVGESGCGKTVAVQSLLRIVDSPPGKIVGGEVLYHGADLLKLAEKDMRQIRGNKISMIFQDPQSYLNPVLTVGDQIAEQMTTHLHIDRAEALRRGVELLRQAGIPDADKKIRQYPHQLSGGMKQRVMIAMALCCDPEIVIADEPTTALDVTVKVQILQIFKALKEKEGRAILFITHDFGTVAQIADRVVVMYGGHAVESGPVRSVFSKPRHPYTLGLIGCLPDISRKRERLASIPGTVPSLIKPVAGCIFQPRCSRAMKVCGEAKPPVAPMPDSSFVACHLYGDK